MKNKTSLFFVSLLAIFAIIISSSALVSAEENNSNFGQKPQNLIAPGLKNKLEKVESEVRKRLENNNPERETPVSVNIGPEGQARITNGNVTSVNGNLITVNVFGINFSVDISNAKVFGALGPSLNSNSQNSSSTETGSQTSTTTVNVGDRVSLNGKVDSSTGVIKAEVVHNLSAKIQSNREIVNKINELLEMINRLKAQLGM
jgi:hypothetical protein